MLLGEMQNLARQVAERPVSRPLWLAAVHSAISAAGRFDERLELSTEHAVTLVTGATTIAVPTGKLLNNLLGVFRDDGNGFTTKLKRWRKTDPQQGERMRQGGLWVNPAPTICSPGLTWDAVSLGFVTFSIAQTIDIPILLRFQYIPAADTDEVPEYLLFGALAWVGKNMLQDARAPGWQEQFEKDMDGVVATAITASSVPLEIGG